MTVSRYIVQPLLGSRGIPYYVVVDTANDHGVEGYGCELWAQHRADALNRKRGKEDTRCTNVSTAGCAQ